MQSFEYELDVCFEYAYDGEMRDAKTIVLKAPTANNSRFTAKLKQGFFQAMGDLQKTNNAETSDDAGSGGISGDEILSLLMMSKSVDFGKYVDDFKAFMCKGIAMIDGVELFKERLFDNLSEDDLMAIMGLYLENFLIASFLKKII